MLNRFIFKVKELAESLAFLNQNEMNIIIVLGSRLAANISATNLNVSHLLQLKVEFQEKG